MSHLSKERYPLHESVGDPTQAVDEGEPPYPRYIWVWELGMWERKQWHVWDRKRRVRAFTTVAKLDGLYWSGKEAPTAAGSQAAANRHVRLAEEDAEGERQAAAVEAASDGKALKKTTQVQKPPLVLPEPSKGTRQSRRVMEKKAAELATEVPEPANQQTEGTGKSGRAAMDDHVETPAQDKPTVRSVRGRGRSRARGGGNNQPAAEKGPAKASKRGGAKGTKRGVTATGAKRANEPDETAP